MSNRTLLTLGLVLAAAGIVGLAAVQLVRMTARTPGTLAATSGYSSAGERI